MCHTMARAALGQLAMHGHRRCVGIHENPKGADLAVVVKLHQVQEAGDHAATTATLDGAAPLAQPRDPMVLRIAHHLVTGTIKMNLLNDACISALTGSGQLPPLSRPVVSHSFGLLQSWPRQLVLHCPAVF